MLCVVPRGVLNLAVSEEDFPYVHRVMTLCHFFTMNTPTDRAENNAADEASKAALVVHPYAKEADARFERMDIVATMAVKWVGYGTAVAEVRNDARDAQAVVAVVLCVVGEEKTFFLTVGLFWGIHYDFYVMFRKLIIFGKDLENMLSEFIGLTSGVFVWRSSSEMQVTGLFRWV